MDADLALRHIRQTRIIAVLRGDFPPEKAVAVCEVLLENGLNLVELTYNSPDWRAALPALKTAFGEDIIVAMGTVLNAAQVREALDAGAEFLVAPSFDAASVATAHAGGVLMAPGIATPTEAVAAANHGCKLLKFFPAGALGIDYFKAMRGPLNTLDFCCNGNMHVGNIADFFRAGATACGLGGEGLTGSGSRPLAEIRAIAQDVAGIVKSL